MAVKIRFRPQGRNNRAFYRLVATDSRSPCDGKYIEMLGWYDPLLANEANVHLNEERIQYWLSQGAELSERTHAILKRKAPALVKGKR